MNPVTAPLLAAVAVLGLPSGAASAQMSCFVAPRPSSIDDAVVRSDAPTSNNILVCTGTDGHVVHVNHPQADRLQPFDKVEIELELPPPEARLASNESSFISSSAARVLRVTERTRVEDLSVPPMTRTSVFNSSAEHQEHHERRRAQFIQIKDIRFMFAIRMIYNNGEPSYCGCGCVREGFQGNSGRNLQNFMLQKSNFQIDFRRKTGPSSAPLEYCFDIRMNKNVPSKCQIATEVSIAADNAFSQLGLRTDQVSHVEYYLPSNFPDCEGLEAGGLFRCNIPNPNRITEKRGACYTVLKTGALSGRIAALSRNLGLLRHTAYLHPGASAVDRYAVMGGFMGRGSISNMRIFSAAEYAVLGWISSRNLGTSVNTEVTLAPLNFPSEFVSASQEQIIRLPCDACTSGAATGGYVYISLRGAYDDSWYEDLPADLANKVVIEHAGGRAVDLIASLSTGEGFTTQGNHAIVNCGGSAYAIGVAIKSFTPGTDRQDAIDAAKARCSSVAMRSATIGLPWSCGNAQAFRNQIGKQKWPQSGEEWCNAKSFRRNANECSKWHAVDYWGRRPIIYQTAPCRYDAGSRKCVFDYDSASRLVCPETTRSGNCSTMDTLMDLRDDGLTMQFRDVGDWCASGPSKVNQAECEKYVATTYRAYSQGGDGPIYFDERQRCRWISNKCQLGNGPDDIAYCVV